MSAMQRLLYAGIIPLAIGCAAEVAGEEPVHADLRTQELARTYPAGRLKVLDSQQCLVARAGAGERPVQRTPCASYSDQLWVLEYLDIWNEPEGIVQIKNLDRGLCMVTRGSGESRAVVSTCDDRFWDQLWYVQRDGNTGYYQLINVASNLCLVARSSGSNTQAVQSTCNARWADQLWIFDGWF